MCNGLREPDLERSRVNGEERVVLVDDLPILERDACQRATDLCAQLHPMDGRELAKENQRAGDGVLQW